MHECIDKTNVWMYNCKEIKFAFQFWETWEDRERVKALQQDKRQQRIWAIYERWSVIGIGRKDTKLSSSWIKNSDILTWRQASFWCVSMRGRELTPCWGYELMMISYCAEVVSKVLKEMYNQLHRTWPMSPKYCQREKFQIPWKICFACIWHIALCLFGQCQNSFWLPPSDILTMLSSDWTLWKSRKWL